MKNKFIYISSDYDVYEFKTKRIWRTDSKYEPFVYIIQEIETGMMYIGSRTKQNCLESDLGTKYFTSSRYINWNNINSFKILNIFPCASNHDAIILESITIEQYNAVWDDMYYNLSKAGKTFNSSGLDLSNKKGNNKHRLGIPHTDEAKLKISKAAKGNAHRLGIPHTDEAKRKSGRPGKLHHFYGKPCPEEQKIKSSKKQKGIPKPKEQCPHCLKYFDKGNLKQWHGDKCKKKL